MSGWNGSRVNDKKITSSSAAKNTAPGTLRGAVAGVLAVCGITAALYFYLVQNQTNEEDLGSPNAPAPESRKTAQAKTGSDVTRAERVRKVKAELNDQVKEFVKKSTGTNNVTWIVPPLAPDDPDRALQTGVMQELGSLLSVEPGEQMPPFPYSFLIEDDMKARGEDVGDADNGNEQFLASLKRFKIQAKETDDEHRLAHKEKLIQAQGELLSGINEGISVNDSIRAAYEFRMRAYEMRSTIIDTLSELHEKDGDTDETVRQLRNINKQLAEEGIKKISLGEVIEDYEPEEGDEK